MDLPPLLILTGRSLCLFWVYIPCTVPRIALPRDEARNESSVERASVVPPPNFSSRTKLRMINRSPYVRIISMRLKFEKLIIVELCELCSFYIIWSLTDQAVKCAGAEPRWSQRWKCQ